MRSFITKLLVFASFAVLFSGCTSSSDSNRTAGNDQNASIESAENEATKTSSEYPPLPEKIADAEMEGVDHSITKLSDRKGKVVFLNLWATWCGYCRIEMPYLIRMQNEHGEKGLEIIGLNTDDEPVDKINSFAQEMKLNYTLAWGDIKMISDLLKISKSGGIPQSFLIDRNGNLRAVFLGAGPEEIKKMESIVAKVVDE